VTSQTLLTDKDHMLLAGLAQGDRQVFRQLFDTYHSRLYSLSFQMLRDSDKAKDVVQEVFIKVWNNREKISVTHSLEAYLKRSVINTTLNVIENEKRHSFLSLFNPSSVALVDRQNQTLIDNADELRQTIDKAILSLPARTRAVFVLVRIEQMSYDQVSESLQISNKAVEKEMMKALRLLREQLKHFLTVSVIPTLAFIFS
jgi:RNA polymerase sigma-70 factor (ECF subfamily)